MPLTVTFHSHIQALHYTFKDLSWYNEADCTTPSKKETSLPVTEGWPTQQPFSLHILGIARIDKHYTTNMFAVVFRQSL